MRQIIPKGYCSKLSTRETEVAIKKVKDHFERELALALNLTRVSAPRFVRSNTGLNDTLNGFERPVVFDIKDGGDVVEVVHSLAKWKRDALKRYGFHHGEGLYTDMDAIRRDEDLDNIHSLYVDQWDWELIINKEERTVDTLKCVVRKIYKALKNTEAYLAGEYDFIDITLPEDITFITTQELYDMYPHLDGHAREKEAAKKYGAVFLMQIGGKLSNGQIHDGRAPDYDDWSLNGDIIVYYPLLDIPFELSSMGIRVDEEALLFQLKERDCMERIELPFQKSLLAGELPYTIGGGLGQSRMCMFFLQKAHIGEVQSSIWPASVTEVCEANGIYLL